MNCHHAKARKWANHYRRNHGPFNHRRRKARWSKFNAGWAYPPANVQEFDDRYELSLFASGFSKSDFKIALENNILTVSVDQVEAKAPNNASWRRREFFTKNFERRFELNEKIDQDGIKAEYKDGVLEISLPKLEEFYTTRRDITIE